MSRSDYKYWVVGALAGILLTVLTSIMGGPPTIAPDGAVADFTIGVIQLVALFFPALMILIQILLNFSHRRSQESGKAGSVGPMNKREFQALVLFLGGLISLLLVLGLGTLYFAMDLPGPVYLGTGFIFVAIAMTPMLLFVVAYNEWRDL